jgi:aerobic-type carbon monoxide dehydrogenase small subunit (CoxS/CutS family)
MEETKEKSAISRREFLKDAGFVVGGATVASLPWMNSCSKAATETVTITGPSITTTQTLSKYLCAVCGQEFASLAALQTHVKLAHPAASVQNLVTLNINSVDYTLQVQPWWNLAFVMRDKLGFFGVKVGCEMGQCGTCTVLADGVPVLACLSLAIQSQGKKYTTIEGLSGGFALSKIQQKFFDNEAFQCGYCTPGIIMASQALVTSNAKPTAADVREALSGHICVCQNFKKVVETVTGGI